MVRYKKIVIATKNPAKLEYYKPVLLKIADCVVGLAELGINEKPVENGATAEENAQIKVTFYAALCGLPAFSEDEALYADFLSEVEQPCTHVRRINGVDEVDDETLLSYWEKKISAVPIESRRGRWHIAYCLGTPDGNCKVTSLDHHVMFFSPSSKIKLPGWPMSSLEGNIKFGKPNSELTDKEKQLGKELVLSELAS